MVIVPNTNEDSRIIPLNKQLPRLTSAGWLLLCKVPMELCDFCFSGWYYLGCDKIKAMSEIPSDLRVQIGYQVELELIYRSGERERLAFDLVPDNQADYPARFLAASTSLAQAILGEKIGIPIPFFTDELMAVDVLSICESTRSPETDTATRREAVSGT